MKCANDPFDPVQEGTPCTCMCCSTPSVEPEEMKNLFNEENSQYNTLLSGEVISAPTPNTTRVNADNVQYQNNAVNTGFPNNSEMYSPTFESNAVMNHFNNLQLNNVSMAGYNNYPQMYVHPMTSTHMIDAYIQIYDTSPLAYMSDYPYMTCINDVYNYGQGPYYGNYYGPYDWGYTPVSPPKQPIYTDSGNPVELKYPGYTQMIKQQNLVYNGGFGNMNTYLNADLVVPRAPNPDSAVDSEPTSFENPKSAIHEFIESPFKEFSEEELNAKFGDETQDETKNGSEDASKYEYDEIPDFIELECEDGYIANIPVVQTRNRVIVYQPSSDTILGAGTFGLVQRCKIHPLRSPFELEKSLFEPGCNSSDENFYNRLIGQVALKTIAPEPKILANIRKYSRNTELKFIYSVPYHENLLSVKDVFIDRDTWSLNIVTEKMEYSLRQLITTKNQENPHYRFSPFTIISIMKQILSGLNHMHHYGYMHCDLKPENILVTETNKYYSPEFIKAHRLEDQEYVVKICDYGQADTINCVDKYEYIGTLNYNSPESLLQPGRYNDKHDIWAVGCMIFDLMNADYLFNNTDRNRKSQIDKIIELLGSPDRREDEKLNLYGYDSRMARCLDKLGSDFSNHKMQKGIKIEELLGCQIDFEYSLLCALTTSCLRWNENERPSCYDLWMQFHVLQCAIETL